MKFIHTSLSLAVFAVLSAPSLAQQAMEEVVVTSTKRAESIQDVPLSVSVISGELMERAEVRDLLDLQSLVPSLRVPQFQNSTQTNFVIRGFGNGANNPGIEPSVAVFIDGVYRSRSLARISDLPNIQQIEVLRGPQSTLYGKNASAGVISVTTSQPEFEQRGNLEFGIGNMGQKSTRGYITGPLSETVAYSLGGSLLQRDGYFDNPVNGNAQNERDRWTLRGELLVTPSEDTELRVIYDYDELDEVCCGTANLIDGPAGAALAALSTIPGTAYDSEAPFSFRTYGNLDPINRSENSGLTVDFRTMWGGVDVRSITGYRDSYSDQPQADIDYSAADAIGNQVYSTDIQTFTQEFRLSGETENMDWLIGGFYFDESIDFVSAIDFGSQWRNYANILVAGTPAGGEAITGSLEALLGYAPGTFFAPGTGVQETATQENETYSFFGQMTYALSDKTDVTVGMNFLDDDKAITLNQENTDIFAQLQLDGADGATALTNAGFLGAFPGAFAGTFGLPYTPENVALVSSSAAGAAGLAGLQAGVLAQVAGAVAASDLSDPAQNPFVGLQALQFLPPMLGIPNPAQPGTSNDEKITYTVSLSHAFSDNLNAYATYATGYKATSWNLSRDTRPTAGEYNALVAAGEPLPNNLTLGTRLAGPEESEVIELGVKYDTSWGYINAAIFDQTIEGFQSNAFTGAGFNLTNAGKQSVDGFEVDMMVRPTDNLSIALSATVLDPLYDDFQGAVLNGAPADFSGLQPAGIHELSFSAVATYDFTVGGWDGFVQADYQHDSEVDINDGGDLSLINQQLEALGSRKREVNMFNASIGFKKNDWQIRLWGRNLTDDQWLITWFPSVAQTGSVSGYPNQPRTVGATIRRNF